MVPLFRPLSSLQILPIVLFVAVAVLLVVAITVTATIVVSIIRPLWRGLSFLFFFVMKEASWSGGWPM